MEGQTAILRAALQSASFSLSLLIWVNSVPPMLKALQEHRLAGVSPARRWHVLEWGLCLVLLCSCFPSLKHRSCCARGCVHPSTCCLLPALLPWPQGTVSCFVTCHQRVQNHCSSDCSALRCAWVLGCPCGMEQLSIPWRCTLVFLGVTWSCASLALGFTTCHCAMSLCHVTMLCRHCLALISPKDIKGNFLQPHLLIFHRATEQPAQPSLQSRAAPSTFVFSSWFCQLLL